MSNPAATHPQSCDYCGLPLGKPLFAALFDLPPPEDTDARYCCVGCRFASEITTERGVAGQTRWTLMRLGVAIFFTMNVMVFTMALWTQDIYREQGELTTAAALWYELFRYLCLVLTAPVVLLLGGPLVEDAVANLRRGQLTTDVLLATGVSAALAYSLKSLLDGQGHVYFEVVCMVLVAVTLGRWLEATGKLKTTDALRSLYQLLPDQVRVVHPDVDRLVDLAKVDSGQTIRVLAGERIPLDGQLESSSASIDQQLVTGESRPVCKTAGVSVFAGTLNLDGAILIRVTEPASRGTIQTLVDQVLEAANAKSRDTRLADRLAAWFVPVVFLIAAIVFCAHLATSDFQTALMAALAVTLIACPCALGIATPLALWAALGRASREQVLFRDGDALTRLAMIRTVCFDKTGTLTTGKPRVERLHEDGLTPTDVVWATAAQLAALSTHSFSVAICRANPLPSSFDRQFAISDVKNLSGRGLDARVAGTRDHVHLGSLRLMNESGLQLNAQLQAAVDRAHRRHESIVCVGWAGTVRGVFVFTEQLRPSAEPAIASLGRLGLRSRILTGDDTPRAHAAAQTLGIAAEPNLLPTDKQLVIARLKSQAGPVAMVGDGINDAPALATADVGIAMGCGADISRDAADVCLLGSDLARLPWAIALARKTRRAIRHNLFWAFAYNLVGMALAATGWLNPIFAAVAMVGSSLFVVTNSLRLGDGPRIVGHPRDSIHQREALAPWPLDDHRIQHQFSPAGSVGR